MDKNIKYEAISQIGMELFKKNNDSFMKSKLSHTMSNIFMVANKDSNIKDTDSEYYMKSGVLPNRVFYIYSDKVKKSKIFDIVRLNDEICIWFYSKNAIEMIDKNPLDTIVLIYHTLMKTFKGDIPDSFISIENFIAASAMSIKLVQFLHETYGLIDVEKFKDDLTVQMKLLSFSPESTRLFINDVLDNYYNKDYFNNRDYLTSYLLLEEVEEEDTEEE